MLVLYNTNQDNRHMIQELITHTIDSCAPLIDVTVCIILQIFYSHLFSF